jgi:soluble lytic murein transglycosylase-like protein
LQEIEMPRIQQVLLPGVFVAVVIVIVFTSQISSASAAQIPNPPATSLADAVQSPLPTSVPQSDCGLSIRFPDGIRQWCGLIGNYAQKYGLESQLIAAVMLQESGGDPNAYSPSGAVGLMQVMPRDGLAADFMCNGRPCFSARPAMADLFDPEFNISYGVRMLAGLIQKYGGVRDALRAYGPSDAGYSYADKVLAIYQNYQ